MKKYLFSLISLILVISVVALSFASCGNDGKNSSTTSASDGGSNEGGENAETTSASPENHVPAASQLENANKPSSIFRNCDRIVRISSFENMKEGVERPNEKLMLEHNRETDTYYTVATGSQNYCCIDFSLFITETASTATTFLSLNGKETLNSLDAEYLFFTEDPDEILEYVSETADTLKIKGTAPVNEKSVESMSSMWDGITADTKIVIYYTLDKDDYRMLQCDTYAIIGGNEVLMAKSAYTYDGAPIQSELFDMYNAAEKVNVTIDYSLYADSEIESATYALIKGQKLRYNCRVTGYSLFFKDAKYNTPPDSLKLTGDITLYFRPY